MKYFKIEKYCIEIDDVLTSDVDPMVIDNYDFSHFKKTEYQLSTMYEIRILQDENLIKTALIGSVGGGTTIHKNSIIIEDERLVICCSDSIFCLSIPELNLIWQTQADQATCFEIYKYEDSYIIHGELEITRLDKDGNILWQNSGADIFTNLDGKDSFVITDNYILATDWENRKYKFDFNGNSVK